MRGRRSIGHFQQEPCPLAIRHRAVAEISRNARALWQAFLSGATAEGRPLLVPCFAEADWPSYQRIDRARPDLPLLGLMRQSGLNGQKVNLFGFSGGAQCAQRFAMLYAPDQFEGLAEIDRDDCDMLAGGGCLGHMVWRHDRMKAPTRVQPVGRLADATGKVLTTTDFALPDVARAADIPLIIVVGTAMNSGKTTATVALTHGLTRTGWVVAALKGTGTGSFGDVNDSADAGAAFVGDFTDAGMVTTYLEPLPRPRRPVASWRLAGLASGRFA